MRVKIATAAIGLTTLLCACSSASSTSTLPAAPAGPAQNLTLSGKLTATWISTTDPKGVVGSPPPGIMTTACYAWQEPNGRLRWSAHFVGAAEGHSLMLILSTVGQPEPQRGYFPTSGLFDAIGMASGLTVDNQTYGYAGLAPDRSTQSSFTIDGDGTTGTVDAYFAKEPNSPQFIHVTGRWHCL